MTARNRAFSYTRFSTALQKHGDSIRRQADAADRYCHQHGLVLDDQLQLLDEGRSAFKGKHLDPEKASLGKFMVLAEAGKLPRDAACLLCDDVSRLTRLGWLESANLLSRILQTGIDVVFTDSGERVTKENFSKLAGALVFLLRAETGHQESKDKSRKLAEVKAANRADAAESGRIATRALPAWLECHGSKLVEIHGRPARQGGKLRLIPARAKIVREIFERYVSGEGKRQIAAALNTRGVPTWGAFQAEGGKRRPAKFWHHSYVRKILSSPAAMGTWVPRSYGEEQAPIENYFPAAVSAENYQRVAELTQSAKSPGRGNAEIQNPLSGLAKCPLCGDSLTRINKGVGFGEPRLVCVRAKSGKGCTYHSVRLSEVVAALRRSRAQIAKARPITDDTLLPLLSQKGAELADVNAKLERLADMALSGAEMPTTMLTRMRDLEKRQGALREELAALTHRQEHSESRFIVARVQELVTVLGRDDAAPKEVNAALRAVFAKIVVDYQLCALECRWLHMPDGAPLTILMDVPAIKAKRAK